MAALNQASIYRWLQRGCSDQPVGRLLAALRIRPFSETRRKRRYAQVYLDYGALPRSSWAMHEALARAQKLSANARRPYIGAALPARRQGQWGRSRALARPIHALDPRKIT